MFRFADRFIPAGLRQSIVAHRRAQIFVLQAFLGPPIGLLLCGIVYWLDPHPGAVLAILAGGLILYLIYPFLLKLTARLTLLALLALQQLTFTILLASAQNGGVQSPFLSWLAILPVLAAFFVDSRSRLLGVVAAMTIAQTLAFYGLDMAGYRLPQTMPLAALEVAGVVSICCLLAFLWTMSNYYARVVALQQLKLEREMDEHRGTAAKLRQAMLEAERAHALETQLQHSQRLEALGTLAGGIAHEINNALVPVIGLTTLVARRLPEDDRNRRSLETALGGAARARDLVTRILSFSRKEEQRCQPVDLAVVLNDALGMMRATLPATIRLEQEIVATAPLEGDAMQLHQAIVNLVTNAAQAIGDAIGRIAIRLAADADPGCWRLSVADTGCGMDEATRARLFEPFFTTKEVGIGTGLGLTVVHGVVQSHGGRIEVESAPGRGSRFDVVVPRRAGKTEEPGAQASPLRTAARSAP